MLHEHRRPTHFVEDLLEASKDNRFMQLVAVELEPFDEFLYRALRLEGQEGQAEGDVSPLAGILRKPEALAQLLDDILCLFFLFAEMLSSVIVG